MIEEYIPHRFSKNKLVILIVGAITIAFLLVVAAMAIYWASGAAQVDLSRPGYSAVRQQAVNNETDRPFESSGEITPAVFDSFEKRYNAKAKRVFEARVFSPDAMSNKTLRIPE